MSYYDMPGAAPEYYAAAGMGRVGPGIDISHYGAPYAQMLGLGETGMLYRYGAGMGQYSGPPSDDPRMVKRYTVVRSTYDVRGLGGNNTAARAANVVLSKARQFFSGNTVRKIGSTGWIAGGRVGYEVILANETRAGEIKEKNFKVGQTAASAMGGNVRFADARTAIPANAFVEAPPEAPAISEEAPSATAAEEEAAANGGFFSKKVGGVPVWAVGGVGILLLGGVFWYATRPPARRVSANRRRRKRRRSSRRRR